MIRIVLGLALACAALPAAAHAQPARAGRIERTLLPGMTIVGEPTRYMALADRMAHYKVPAISVAVFDRGRIVWSRAYGNAAAGRPATERTLFQAASISKPVFAAAALRLVHEGRLHLDRPINQFLRSWRVPDSLLAPGSAVTLRQLLSHSGGLSVHGFRGYAAGESVPSLRQLLDGVRPANSEAIRITQQPGKAWRYSGGGTSVAQQAAEDVARRPVAEIMRRSILAPAGMRDSSYDQPLPPSRARFAALAHDGEGAPLPGGWHIYPEQAAAGLWTTPTDLARFALWVIEGARRTSGGDEVQRFVAKRLMEPQPGLSPGPDERMGLGFFLQGEGRAFRFSHGGSNAGFRAFLVGFPETGQGAAIMVNGDDGYPLVQELLRAIALEYGWPHRFHEMIVPLRLTETQLAPFAGTWLTGEGENDRVDFTPAEGGLISRRPGAPTTRLVAVDPHNFIAPETGIRLRFDGDTLLIRLPNGPSITARRQPPPAQ